MRIDIFFSSICVGVWLLICVCVVFELAVKQLSKDGRDSRSESMRSMRSGFGSSVALETLAFGFLWVKLVGLGHFVGSVMLEVVILDEVFGGNGFFGGGSLSLVFCLWGDLQLLGVHPLLSSVMLSVCVGPTMSTDSSL